MEQKLLFPGYVFLESENSELLEKEIKKYQDTFAKLQVEINRELSVIEAEEQQLLNSLCGNFHHIGLSKGFIHEGQTLVTSGPLQGKERLIRKIDRHKRMAKVEVPGRMKEMNVGLEIESKS